MTPIHIQLILIAVMLVILLWALYVQRNARALLAKVRATNMGARHELQTRINAEAMGLGWQPSDNRTALQYLTEACQRLSLELIAERERRAGINPPAPSTRPTPPPNPPPAPGRGVGWVIYMDDGTAYRLGEFHLAVNLFHHMRTAATKLGWAPESAEGVYEFLTRSHYAQGVADARNTPLSAAALELAETWKTTGDNEGNVLIGVTLVSCADQLRRLATP